MTKQKLKLLALSVLVLALPAVVQAQLLFTTNSGAITITGYTGSPTVVNIPSAINGYPVTTIGYNAFSGCYSLTNAIIPSSVTSINDYAFLNCNLSSVTIPNGVTSIGNEAFGYNTSLKSVTFGNSVISIGIRLFEGCTGLPAITVDTNNPAYASVAGVLFNKSTNMLVLYPQGKTGSYIIPGSVTSIGDWAFDSCANLTSVTIPNGVTSIGYEAFCLCWSLTSVTIPNSVISIGEWAFDGCNKMTNVTIGNSVNSVGRNAFYGCGSLAKVVIPDSVISIGDWAFSYCQSLTNVTIGRGVTSIGEEAFIYCSSLPAVTVDVLNPAYCSVAGVLFNKSTNTLILYPSCKGGNYTIPNGVTTIGNYAFFYCTNLTSIMIPNSVTSIGNYAFEYCYSLAGVYFQGNAPSFGWSMFDGAPATVYYLPGMTGWYSPFGGRPAFLWNPQAQTSDTQFGVRTNRFGFNLTGSSNLVLVVEACTNLSNPVWQPVSTNTLTTGTSYFSDPQWTNFPGRFYRLRSP